MDGDGVGVAEYAWNDTAYDPERSSSAGLDEPAGGDARTADALHTSAGVQRSSWIGPRPAPELAAQITEFRSTGRAGPLHRAPSDMHDAPGVLRDRLADPVFLAETGPWPAATEARGRAALVALDMLTAQRAGRGAGAWAARQQLSWLGERAKSFTWAGFDPNRKVPVELDPVLEEFVRQALEESARRLGPAQPSPVRFEAIRSRGVARDRAVDRLCTAMTSFPSPVGQRCQQGMRTCDGQPVGYVRERHGWSSSPCWPAV